MLHMTTAELKDNLDSSFEQVSAEGEPVIVSKNNRVLAIVLPIPDPSLLEYFEDAMDAAAVRRSLEEGGEPIPFERVKRELGI